MKIICDTEELNRAISVVSRCIPARPVKECYSFICIEADDSSISVSATDGAMYMVANIEAAPNDVEETGVVALDGKLLAAITQKQQETRIELTSDEKSCKIKCGKAKTQLPLRPADDFPDMPPVSKNSRAAKIPQNVLKSCIDYVSFCTSIDQTRKVLTGVLLDFSDSQLVTVGLDGFRMATYSAACEFEGENVKCLLPKESAVEIANLLQDDSDEPITLRMNKEYLHIWAGNYAFSTVLLAGEYIEYGKIIPKEYKGRALVDSRQLRGCVERAQVMAHSGKNNLIHMSFGGNALQFKAESADGFSDDEIEIGFQGDSVNMAFNSHYLLDMLRHEPDGQLDISLNSSVSPVVVRPLNIDSRLQLVLPVRVLGKEGQG